VQLGLTRPAFSTLKAFHNRSRSLSLSYPSIGLARETPAGWNVDEQSGVIGSGERDFERARAALARWQQFAFEWVQLFPADAPQVPGQVVAVAARACGLWWLNGCRVVYRLDDSSDNQRCGFAYGTLANHAEVGEEIFEVSLTPGSHDVVYRIRAVSRPRALAARLGYPYTRVLQARFRRESIAAMRLAVAGAR